MKLASFVNSGQASYGIVRDNTIADIGAHLRSQFPDLKSLLAKDALGTAKDAAKGAKEIPLADCEMLPVIPNPDKILCIGLNYESHRQETGRDKTAHPAVFLRFADSQTAHLQPVWIPKVSMEVDFEGELAVIIGREGRYIPTSEAMGHIAGYACYNDVSIRDWQRHTSQFTAGKNFPRTGAFGPWMVTADEIPDPQSLELTTRLNHKVTQQANTCQMIFPIAALIAYCSSFSRLRPGDVIATGTPSGVGFKREPPLFMREGDVVEVEISRIGVLRNNVVREPE